MNAARVVTSSDAACPQCGWATARVRVHGASRIAATCARCGHSEIRPIELDVAFDELIERPQLGVEFRAPTP
jgi:hypothetical protein